jgi:four helix bundle protein
MKIRSHKDLIVFKCSFELALQIHQLSKSFPLEEEFSLTDQIRRSSRSVSTNIAEAFRK